MARACTVSDMYGVLASLWAQEQTKLVQSYQWYNIFQKNIDMMGIFTDYAGSNTASIIGHQWSDSISKNASSLHPAV
jgi:hypothetical protein